MKLTGWSIDGFGIFRDYEVRELGDGLTIFCGPNEAGKSTLLAFLRGMLFGFPDGRSRDGRYLPLRGGRHGGRIFIQPPDGSGNLTVERQPGKKPPLRITLPNGRLGREADLQELLGGSDDRLYKSIFAFSLTELQSFNSLTAEGVRDRIFSAGIAGAGRSARHAVRDLDRRATTLLRARSQAPVNDRLADLAAIRSRIEEARGAAGGYLNHVREEDASAAEIVGLGQQSDALRGLKARYQTLLDLWPVWHERQTSRAELEALEVVDQVPHDAEARLAGLLQEIKAAEETIRELNDFQSSAERRLLDLNPDESLTALGDEVESLYEALSLHRSLLEQLPAAREQLFHTKDALDAQLRQFGPGWDEARLEAVDRSLPRQAEVRVWEQRLEHSAREIERLKRDLEGAAVRRSQIDQATARLNLGNAPAPVDGTVVEERARALRRLRSNLSDLRVEETEASSHDVSAKERERAIRLLEEEPLESLPAWPIAVVWLVAIAIPAFLWSRGDAEAAIVSALVIALMAAVVTFTVLQRRKRSTTERERRKADLVALAQERQRSVEQRSTHLRRAAALSTAIAGDANTLGVSVRPNLQVLEECEAGLAEQRASFQHWKEGQARFLDAQAQSKAAADDVRRLATELEQAIQQQKTEQDNWVAWKRSSQFPDAMSPRTLLDYFEQVRVGQEAVQARKAAKSTAVHMTQQVGTWEESARAVLAAAGVNAARLEEEALIEQLVELRKRCASDRAVRGTMSALQTEIGDRAARTAVVQTTLDRCLLDREKLLAEANAEDDESLRQRVRVYRQRSMLTTRIADLERQLAARVGTGPEMDELASELDRGVVDEWRAGVDDLDARIEAVQHRRDDELGRQRDAQRGRRTLESSADLASLELERAALEDELAAAVADWQTVTLARALIEDTLRDFERTRQPAVLAEASELFSFVTNGRYQRLLQEHGGEEIAVIDEKGGRRSTEALSRGTAEQLYLCVRLALAAEFARRSEALPFVMDDVLVNFDPERAASVAAVLAKVAKSHQILLFTCHPSTRDLLLSVDPDARVVELQAYVPAEAEIPTRQALLGWEADADASEPDGK